MAEVWGGGRGKCTTGVAEERGYSAGEGEGDRCGFVDDVVVADVFVVCLDGGDVVVRSGVDCFCGITTVVVLSTSLLLVLLEVMEYVIVIGLLLIVLF